MSTKTREHIYLCSLMWDGLWIIQQPICNEIQKDEPVLFVERPVSVFTVLRYPGLWRRLFTWARGPRRVSPSLRVLAPLPLFHLGHRFPRLFKVEFMIQRLWILLWARRRATGVRVLWLDNPLFGCAISRFGETMTVYHTPDEVSEFRTSHGPTMRRLEDQLLARVTVVFAAAEELARVRRARNPRTFAIWNAIDTKNFEAEVPETEFAAVDATSIPRVGFVGVLDSWVDVSLLETAALAHRNVSFIIVGPSRVNDRALRSLRNVHFIGERHRRYVPGILRRVSASLVPFVANALTQNIVPAKVFEALAAGIVPVCTAFSHNLDVLEHQKLVLVARSGPEFVEMVGQAIREDTPARRAELRAFGMRQTWSDRWQHMKRILDDLGPDSQATTSRLNSETRS